MLLQKSFLGRQFQLVVIAGFFLFVMTMCFFFVSFRQIDALDDQIKYLQEYQHLLQLAETRLIALGKDTGPVNENLLTDIDSRMKEKLDRFKVQLNPKELEFIRSIQNRPASFYLQPALLQSERKRVANHVEDTSKKISGLFIEEDMTLSNLMYSVLISVIVLAGGLALLMWRSQKKFISCLKRVETKIRSIGRGEEPDSLEQCGPDSEVLSISNSLDGMAKALGARQLEIEITHHLIAEKKRLRDLVNISLGMADEIGNPLTAVEGAVDLLYKYWKEKEPESELRLQQNISPGECFDILHSQTERIAWMLQQIKNINIFSDTKRELSDINEMLKATVTLMQLYKSSGEVSIETVFDRNIPALVIDRPLMALSFIYLVQNAIDAAWKISGTVRLSTCFSNDSIIINIQCPSVSMEICKSGRCTLPFCPSGGALEPPEFEISSVRSTVQLHNGEFDVFCMANNICGFNVKLPCGEESVETGDFSQADYKEFQAGDAC